MRERIPSPKLVRLLNELYSDLPLVWNRYSEDKVQEIVGECFTLFAKIDFYSQMAKMDPNAMWYKSWCHAHNSRSG